MSKIVGKSAPVTANAQCVNAYEKAANEIGAARELQARALVGKYRTALTRNSGKISVATLSKSIEEAQAALKADGKRDPLGWRPSWAQHVVTVHALMNVEGSASVPLDELFALANDMRSVKDDKGNSVGTDAARTAISAASAEGKTVQDLRAGTPRKAPRKSSPRGAGGKSGNDKADLVALLNETIEALRVRIEGDHRIPEALALALGSAQDALAELSELAHVA